MWLRKFFPSLIGLQTLYEKLYTIALWGMNYNATANIRTNGESWVLRYVSGQEGNGERVYFDVGANVGAYSELIAEVVSPKAAIFSFEPASSTYQQLLSRTSKYPNISAFNIGLGARVEQVDLFSDQSASPTASVFQRKLDHHNISLDKKESVEIQTIDHFCRENDITEIHFLKLDVEGNELNCLKGATDMLSGHKIRYIQFEFGGTQIDARVFFRDFWELLGADYRLFRIVRNGIREITNYGERHEIFNAVNILAELRNR